jgi:hypothetical protein
VRDVLSAKNESRAALTSSQELRAGV